MHKPILKLLCVPLALASVGLAALNAWGQGAPSALSIPGGGFEQAGGWVIADKMSGLSGEQAFSGARSLKIVDESESAGSDVTGPRVPIGRAGLYKLRGQAFPLEGEGLGIYVRVLDREGKLIGAQDDWQRGAPSTPLKQWVPFSLDVRAEENAAFLEVWVHSYGKARVSAYLDDLSFSFEGDVPARAPWPSVYKIKPSEKARLTAADVVGPDGIVYPDWRSAGVPGGIPSVKAVARIEEFGGKAGDELDDSDALERGAQAVGRRGGGALLLGEGLYILNRPVLITHDAVVLRGAGEDKTRIEFRYARPAGGVDFFRPAPNSVVTAASWIEAHADPRDLRLIEIQVNGHSIARTNYMAQHWGGTFSLRTSGDKVLALAQNGTAKLKVIAEYADKRRIEKEISVRTSADDGSDAARVPSQIGAIMFAGASRYGKQIKLARDGERGERQVLVEDAGGLKAGDRILLNAPATPRWNALVHNACKWGNYRRNEFLIESVAGNVVRLNQPLRLQFPIIDGSYIQPISPIRRCGVEGFTLQQTQELWSSGVIFSNAWECWARGVHVVKPGRWPVYFLPSKWCEIRDCRFDDAWYKGGGGTAYVGWEMAYDCLMENVVTSKLRHAPLVQWSASGNVIRNSVFHDSDGQWHSGWTNENLFENCVIESRIGNGGYGYGLWGSPPEDEAHGPNGPRNVVYGCDISSLKAGLWMGGMNEGWLILHNRFRVGSGPGVFAKDASFDHIIAGNAFVLGDAKSAALNLARRDCVGVEFKDNIIAGGSGKAWSGVRPALEQGNQVVAAGELARPRPAVASIFEWQRRVR